MRVIAGRYKGRRLKTPSWEGVRPTSDKVRETLFNILSPRIDGAHVVDGYAGTGAVGIEALSRGAAHVTFIERDPRAVSLIQANLTTCGAEQQGYTIHRGDVAAVLRQLPAGATFDLVLLDPPYQDGVMPVLEAAADRLREDGLVVLERATRRDPDVPPRLARTRDVTSGDSTLTFMTVHR